VGGDGPTAETARRPTLWWPRARGRPGAGWTDRPWGKKSVRHHGGNARGVPSDAHLSAGRGRCWRHRGWVHRHPGSLTHVGKYTGAKWVAAQTSSASRAKAPLRTPLPDVVSTPTRKPGRPVGATGRPFQRPRFPSRGGPKDARPDHSRVLRRVHRVVPVSLARRRQPADRRAIGPSPEDGERMECSRPTLAYPEARRPATGPRRICVIQPLLPFSVGIDVAPSRVTDGPRSQPYRADIAPGGSFPSTTSYGLFVRQGRGLFRSSPAML